MPKKTPKKVVKQTIIREEEEQQQDNPVPQLVREYLLEGTDFPEDLRSYRFQIHVQKYTKEGRAVTVTGRVYEDLEKLPYELGQRFGASRYKLFIKVFDTNNEALPPIKILDFPIEWDGERGSDDDEEVEYEETEEVTSIRELKMLEMKHAHEKEMKQMELQNQLLLAIANSKGGGGGTRTNEIMQFLELGISLGQGKGVPEGDPGMGDGGGLDSVLNHPLGKVLIDAVTQQILKKGIAQPAPAALPVDQAQPVPGPMPGR